MYNISAYEHASVDIRWRDAVHACESVTFQVESGARLYATIVYNVVQSDCSVRIVINANHSSVVSLILIGCDSEKNLWDIEINCIGEHANVSVSIGYILHNNQSLRLMTKQSHTAIGCVSSIVSKGVLFDHSQVDFSGLISLA